ncbi:MAG: trigger factor [Verrucomicrobia bacterium]|nr:trigger factor [Verrucomicrobiota bacterium]
MTRKRLESGIDQQVTRPTVTDSPSRNRPDIFPVNIQLNSVSDTRKSLVVTLDPSEVDAEHKAVVTEVGQQARIPGFRPGKAPAAMITKRFSKEIAEEFKQKIVSKAYRSAMDQQKLDVLNIVNVEPGEVKPGLSAAVTITVDVRPEFKLPDYVGLPTEIASTESTDAEVDSVIEGMRGERAEFKAADRPAAKGDYVKLSYEGRVDGQPISDLASDKQIYAKVPQTWEEVEGANDGVIPGLGKHLSGLKAGDKKDVGISFPADFAPVPALAGKDATYAIEVLEVRERSLPPLDEAFFKANQADNLDALKSSVRNNLKAQKEYQNRSEQRRQVTEVLASKVEFSVPDSLVENETQGVLRQFIEENMRRGVPQEQFEKDKKELFDNARKAATKRVKVQLLLAKIAEEEKLQVSEADIDNFIYREAMRTQQKPEKLVKALSADRDQLRAVQQSIIFDKAVDFLVSKAKVETIPPKA